MEFIDFLGEMLGITKDFARKNHLISPKIC